MEDRRRRLRLGSIRARITALASVVVGIVLFVTAVTVLLLQEQQLTGSVDAALRLRANEIEALVANRADPAEALGEAGTFDRPIQIVGPGGIVVAASPPVDAFGPAVDHEITRETFRTFETLPIEDDQYRVLSRPIGEGRVLHVASNVEEVRESTRVLAGSLIFAVPVAVIVLAGVVWWLVGRTLRPVSAIQAEVQAITADQLDRRVPRPDTDDEIDQLAATMNEMLDRVDHAVRAQRRFVADASHELRSPLTRIRTDLEIGWAEGEAEQALASLHEEVVGLQALVEDLLHLARSDAGVQVAGSELVDLDDVTQREVASMRATARVPVVTDVESVIVRGSPERLARVVRNLLDNAVRHAHQEVRVSLFEEDGHAVLAVADDGAGIPESVVASIFERFVRTDESRSADQGGTGLGLAIARDIVERHGGTIFVDTEVESGARFVVRLPTE